MTTMEMTKATKKNLPAGWRWVKLGEVCRVFAGSAAPQGKDYFSSVGPFFFRVSDIGRFRRTMQLSESQDRLSPVALARCQLVLARKGAVLFPKSGAAITTNNRALLDVDGYIVSHLMALEPTDAILAEWVYHATCRIDMMDFSDNTGYPSLKQSVVEKIQIPLPPLDEQRRIAGVLRDQMAAVEKARMAAQARLEAVKDLPAALLRQVFPQPGQPLPDGWRWVKLGEVCDGPGQYGTSNKSNGDQRGVPVLGMYHIHEGRIRWENVSYVDLQSEELPKYLLFKGDLLFNRTNSAELVGKTAVYDTGKAAVFASYLIRFRFTEGTADSHFVSAFINSREGRRFIEENMARAIGQANISASTMRMMPIPLPPLTEQRRIAGVLREQRAAVDKARAAAEEELNTINALPAALLCRAFAGES